MVDGQDAKRSPAPKTTAEHDEELFERLENRLEALGILTDPRQLRGAAERSMLRTLATRERPLLDPDGFERAHRGFARALEAISVNGRERPTLSRRLGFLRPVVTPFVQLVASWIIQSQTSAVFRHVRRMYGLREANSTWGSREHVLLRRARMQMQIQTEDVGASKLSVPLFLLSGAFLSGLLSLGRAVVEPALHDELLTVLLSLATFLILLTIALVVLQGASIAKMRLRLVLRVPVRTLYETIGSTGSPPRDRCFQVALIALGFFALAVVAIPGGVFFLLRG